MSDSDLGQRVYSDVDAADGRVQAKIVGHASDPSLGASAQYQQLIDDDGNAHVQPQGNDPAGANKVIRTSELGSSSVDGVYDGVNNTDPSQVGLVGMARNATPADSQQTLRVTAKANTAGDVRALDVALRDEHSEPYTADNPLPVSISESEGQEIHDENTVIDLAAEATDAHDFSVAEGVKFRLYQILAGASGDFKYELLIGDGAATEVFTRKALRYGTPSKNADMELLHPIVVVGTVNTTTIRVIRTNKHNKQMDISTTIIGVQD